MSESILKKIKQLLALAKSANEHESKLAYEKAMELMIKHNIESIGEDKKYEYNERSFPRENAEVKFTNQIIMNCFFVKIMRSRKYNQQFSKLHTVYKYAGTPMNVEVALYAFDFLIEELKAMWDRAKKVHRLKGKQRESYYLGVVVGFSESYRKVKNYSEEKYQLIVPENDPELDEWIKNSMNVKGTHGCSVRGERGEDAEQLGYSDGSDLKIRQPIDYKQQSAESGLMISM